MTDTLLNFEINGAALQARPGTFVIDAADAAGITIPRFCYHKKLSVAANCRMCLVEVERAPKPLPACATPVAEGMKVFTQSPVAVAAQKAVMEFLLINHPLDCPVCDQGGECELQDLAMGYGRDVSRFQEGKRVVQDKDLGPLVATDMTRCIHCTRCVRFGAEIAGIPELGATGRGEHMEIGTFVERTVDSELSGNIIDLCPVGALTSKPFRFRARAWEMFQRPVIAPHDAVGSNLNLHVRRQRVMRVVPAANEAINEVWISDRDRFSYEGLDSDDRLTVPMVKRDGRWQATDWDTALAYSIEGLQRVASEDGPEQIGALASPSATVEELYLLQKLMRGIGSPNVDHRLRQRDFRDQEYAPPFPCLGASIPDLEHMDAVLLIGSNCRKEQPLIAHRLRKAALRGTRVMTVNALDYPFNFPIAESVVEPPPEMLGALGGIARALISAEREMPGDADAPDDGLHALLSGAEPDRIQQAIAHHLKDAERALVVLGPGASAHGDGAVLRALARFIAERAAAGVGYLSDGANGAGAWLAGAVPHRGAGGTAAATCGLDARAMMERALRAYVLLGIEPELDCGDGYTASEAVRSAAFNVCLTAFRTPAMEEYAHALLPIAPFSESPGTFVNAVGIWQTFSDAVTPRGEARPAWKVLRVMGNRFGLDGFDYVTAPEVCEEVRRLLAQESSPESVSWPIPPSFSAMKINTKKRSECYRVGDVSPYAVDPIVRRARALQRTVDAAPPAVHMNGAQAERLRLTAADTAELSQGLGRVSLPVVIDDRVPDQCVMVPAGTAATAALGPSYSCMVVSKI